MRDGAIKLTREECAFVDAVYLPSKYPAGSLMPDAPVSAGVCARCIQIAERVRESVVNAIGMP